VTCQPSAAWMLNSKNQTPCLVGAYLQAQCMNGSYEVQSLPNLTSFYAPPGNGSDACTCSTVTYSLIAACGWCQDAKALNWTVWQANCSLQDIDVGGYPFDIPTETVVPTWAYLNVTMNNTFDPWAALGEYTKSQSTAKLSTTSASSSSSSSITATPSPTQTLPPSPSHFGVIGGSVVGGFVAAVAILLLIAAYLNRYHRNRRTPSWESESTGLIDGTPKSPQPVGQASLYSMYSPEDLSTPYDPWDPATFSSSSAYSSKQRISVS